MNIIREKSNRIFSSRNIVIISQMILGTLFIAASWGKIIDPSTFTQSIIKYRILSPGLSEIAAYVLPWTELVLGVMIVLNIKSRFSSALIGIILLVFIGALASTLIRGLDINCGCFMNQAPSSSGNSHVWSAIIRDILLLIPCWIIYRKTRKECQNET